VVPRPRESPPETPREQRAGLVAATPPVPAVDTPTDVSLSPATAPEGSPGPDPTAPAGRSPSPPLLTDTVAATTPPLPGTSPHPSSNRRLSTPGWPGTHPAPELPGPRLALVVATTTYADAGFTQLRAPAQDASTMIEVLADPAIG